MRRALALILLAVLIDAPSPLGAQQPCAKADFEAVVDEAAAALRDLNATNKPVFQEKLRQLKEKRGWSHDQFMTAAAPLVQDEHITAYDQKSAEFLDQINSLGSEGASAKQPDCAMLKEVRATMTALVQAQKAKWAYMFDKITKELGP
jgi:hypothetical protein